ncbi:MAG: T9SS type A sorting domain-containing protein [Ignavibacteria bacterium]|nr:T9SS type A sorting domain-containing protein [Ignavibacteria bacterium]
MKKFLILIMLLCGINAVAQENAAALPELQEWYSIKGGVGFYVSHLPGFDPLGGGLNAISYKFNTSNNPVFYNRFPFDTTNQFQWKSGGGYAVFQLDANGDGIPDYFDYLGRIYRGKKEQKPESEPSVNLNRSGTLWTLIGDLNKDSLEDMLVVNSNTNRNFDIILGNKDISKISAVRVSFPVETSHYIGSYFSESGKPRIIFYYDWGSFESFAIYALTITYTGNQPSVTLEQLDIIRTFKGSSDEKLYETCCNYFYWNKRTGQNYLMLTKAVKPGENKVTRVGYTIANDRLIFVKEKSLGGELWSYLECSVDGDENEDFIIPSIIKENGQEQEVLVIYTGLSINNPTAVAFCRRGYCGYSDWVSCIGDVNKDGINDIAFGGSDGCFAVYLGLDWRTVNVNSVAEYDSFKIHQNIPNPVQKDRKTLLPVSLKQQGNYSIVLYSLQGNRIKDLFNGELSEGEHKIPLDLIGLSAGMYIVKMSTGAVSRERAIMIGE